MQGFRVVVEIPMDGPRGVCLTPIPDEGNGRLIVPLNFAGGFVVTGENLMTTLTDSQQVSAGPVSAVSAAGNPAQIDGKPTWDVSDPAVLQIKVSDDGLSAVIAAAGPVGTAQVTVKVDADLGEGVKELSGVLDFEVIAGEAASLVVPVGTPTDKLEVNPLPVPGKAAAPSTKRR